MEAFSQLNKPANVNDEVLEAVYREAIARTRMFENKITILRGTTTEVVDHVSNRSVDLLYLDGDHTLRDKSSISLGEPKRFGYVVFWVETISVRQFGNTMKSMK